MSDVEQLARLRVAVQTHHLPTDLGEWLLAQLEQPARRKSVRNQALQTAADQLEGSVRHRARELATAMAEVRRDPLYWAISDSGDEFLACVVRALVNNDQQPMSERHIRRLIS